MPKPDVDACEGISDGGLQEESGKRWIPITGCLIMLKVEIQGVSKKAGLVRL